MKSLSEKNRIGCVILDSFLKSCAVTKMENCMNTDLSDDYANGPYIADAASYPPKWVEKAAAFRASLGARAKLDQPYGPKPRQRFDQFEPEGEPRGTVVFVHGGYWRSRDKSDWSHLAAGSLARGWRVILPGYTLAPEVRVADITAEIATFCASLSGPVRMAGHSAGGHLICRNARFAERVVSISGVHDLAPLLHTDINDDLHLDAAEAEAESVINKPVPEAEIVIWVGGAERPAFIEQSKALASVWGVEAVIEPDKHHFDVIDSLEAPDGALTNALLG